MPDRPAPDDQPTTDPADTGARGPWDGLADLARSLADIDLTDCCERIHPRLFALEGDEPVAIVELRPFGPGAGHGPLREALDLVTPFGADRAAVAIGGRAWSLDDPVPPVTAGADLRQRVLTVLTVDGRRVDPPETRSWLYPYDHVDGRPDWHPRVEMPGAPAGWVAETVVNALRRRPRRRARRLATGQGLRRTMERCLAAGHEVGLGPVAAARMIADLDPDAASLVDGLGPVAGR